MVRIERPRDREKVVDKYKGFVEEINKDELEKLVEEAELEKL